MFLRIFFCVLLAVIPLSVILVGAEFTAIKQIAIDHIRTVPDHSGGGHRRAVPLAETRLEDRGP